MNLYSPSLIYNETAEFQAQSAGRRRVSPTFTLMKNKTKKYHRQLKPADMFHKAKRTRSITLVRPAAKAN